MRPFTAHVRQRAMACLALTALGVLAATSGALGAPRIATPAGFAVEYTLGSASALGPVQLTTSPDGAVWFSAYTLGKIGRFQLPHSLNLYAIPSANARPTAITLGPDGNVWFAEASYDQIGRLSLNAACPGVVTEFSIPSAQGGGISGITSGANNRVWFSAAGGDIVGSLDLTNASLPSVCANKSVANPSPVNAAGAVDEYRLPAGTGPTALTTDSSGQVWIADSSSSAVSRLNPTVPSTAASFVYLTTWPTPTAQSNLVGIAIGPANRVWFTEADANRIGVISADSVAGDAGAIKEFALPNAQSGPAGITAAPDGAMWFAESTTSGTIGRISANGTVTQYATPAVGGALIFGIAPASDGSLWYSNFLADTVGSMSTGMSPAKLAPRLSTPRYGAWSCTAATWGTPPTRTSTTWLRDGASVAARVVALTNRDVGHSFTCRSTAVLPGLPGSYVSHTSQRLTVLFGSAKYKARVGATVRVSLYSALAQTVVLNISGGSKHASTAAVRVQLRRGSTTVGLALRVGGRTLATGNYVVTAKSGSGTTLTAAALSIS